MKIILDILDVEKLAKAVREAKGDDWKVKSAIHDAFAVFMEHCYKLCNDRDNDPMVRRIANKKLSIMRGFNDNFSIRITRQDEQKEGPKDESPVV